MPPLPPAPQVVRVALTGLTQARPWANIIHLQYIGTRPTNTTLDALCVSIGSAWATSLAAQVASTTSITLITAVDLSDVNGAGGSSNQVVPGTGTGTNPLPVNCALCITWKTAARWRGGHPRTYLPGMIGTNVTNGNQWTSAYRTATNTAATTFHNNLNALTTGGNTWTHVCLRRHQTLVDGSHVVLNPAVPIPITTTLVDSRIDSQRRRLGPDVSA